MMMICDQPNPDVTIWLAQGKKAKAVLPGLFVRKLLTTCCGLVVARYEKWLS